MKLNFAAERRTKWRNLDAIDLLCHVPEMMLSKILNLTWPNNWQLAGSILNSTQLASLWLRCLYWVHSTRPKSQQTLTAQPKKAGSLRNTQLVFFWHKKYRLFYFILFYVKIKPRFERACRSLQCSFILFPFLHNLFDFFTFQQFPELFLHIISQIPRPHLSGESGTLFLPRFYILLQLVCSSGTESSRFVSWNSLWINEWMLNCTISWLQMCVWMIEDYIWK